MAVENYLQLSYLQYIVLFLYHLMARLQSVTDMYKALSFVILLRIYLKELSFNTSNIEDCFKYPYKNCIDL